MKHEQTILGSVPSSNEWVVIPGFNDKYEINRYGQVRAFYRYGGHTIAPHYKLLNNDKGSYVLYSERGREKLCADYLVDLCFGVQHVESLPCEEWKPIRGYEGYYRISNKGRLLAERRFIKKKNGSVQFCKEQIVSAKSVLNSGYYSVNLIKDKKFKHFLVHRLVAEHFVNNPKGYDNVNHKDEDKMNNASCNLEWCDASYNQRYGTCQERRIATRLRNNGGNYGYKRIANR